MPPEKAKAPNEAFEPQDQSIKARKRQLFEEPSRAGDSGASDLPFAEYVRRTPPAPMSPGVKAALWAVGVLVALLFLAALFGGRRPRPVRARGVASGGVQPAARAGVVPAPRA